jgi:hypothetical protein
MPVSPVRHLGDVLPWIWTTAPVAGRYLTRPASSIRSLQGTHTVGRTGGRSDWSTSRRAGGFVEEARRSPSGLENGNRLRAVSARARASRAAGRPKQGRALHGPLFLILRIQSNLRDERTDFFLGDRPTWISLHRHWAKKRWHPDATCRFEKPVKTSLCPPDLTTAQWFRADIAEVGLPR